jgi:hypothetical protein
MTISFMIPHRAMPDQGQVSLTLNPGFTIFTKNNTYKFNNGPKVDIGIGYDTSDESNASFIMGANRFVNSDDDNLSLDLLYAGMSLKQYLSSGVSKGYLTGGLNFDYANFAGTPSASSGKSRPPDDAGIGFDVGAGLDIMASSSFFFGPVLKYEGVILSKTYLSMITFQLSLGLLF